MSRELQPADLLPAIERVAGALAVQLVVSEAARMAAERELAETIAAIERPPAPAERMAAGVPHEPGRARPATPGPADWRNGAEPAVVAP